MRLFSLTVIGLALAACTPATIEAQSSPSAQGSGTLFVANKRGASLSRIDLATGEETHRAETCENPHELTVSPDEQYVLVACYSGQEVQFFRTETLARAGSIGLDTQARVHSAIWHPGGAIVAGAEGRGSAYLITAEMHQGFVHHYYTFEEMGGGQPGLPGPHMIVINADASMAWGTIIPTGEVVRYDLGALDEVARTRIGNQIEALALSPDGESLWVASNAESIAYRLDPMTLEVQAEVPTGEVPIRLAMHPSGDFVVSSNFGSGDLTVIDTRSNTAVRTIPVSGSRASVQVTLVFSEDGSRLYAAETAIDTIAEIDFASGEVLRRIATGPGGDGLVVID